MTDLSSVAREAARVEARMRYGVGVEPVIRRVGFEEGAEWCASRLASERDIEIAILGRTATQAAKAVHALIERGLGEPQD